MLNVEVEYIDKQKRPHKRVGFLRGVGREKLILDIQGELEIVLDINQIKSMRYINNNKEDEK